MDTQTFIIPADKIRVAADRRGTIRSDGTNALRLFDGAGDRLSDLVIDDFAGRWIVQTKGKQVPVLDPGGGYRSLYWKPLMKSSKRAPNHIGGAAIEEPFVVRESGLKFEIDFRVGYSPGLFLDQRTNRLKLSTLAGKKTVLNTFAYTCAFGVAAASSGATTVNLDLSRNHLDWGKRNYGLNRITPEEHDFIFGDVFDWLCRFRRRGRKFDVIILDPPTFSRNRNSKVFRIQDDFGELADLAVHCLNRNGLLFCSTNFRGITFDDLLKILTPAVRRPFRAEPGSMPPDFTGDKYLKTVWMQF